MSDKPTPAALHIAEKIRQSIRASDVMVYEAFGIKKVKVMIDMEAAEQFVRETEERDGK